MVITYKTVQEILQEIKFNSTKKKHDIIEIKQSTNYPTKEKVDEYKNDESCIKATKDEQHFIKIWNDIQLDLLKICGKDAFESWFKCIILGTIKNNCVYFAAPTEFVKDWIMVNYYDKLLRLWHKHIPEIKSIDIIVKKSEPKSEIKETFVIKEEDNKEQITYLESENHDISQKIDKQSIYSKIINNDKESDKDPNIIDKISKEDKFKVILDSRYTFSNFIVGKPNNFAFEAAKRVSEMEHPSNDSNPLFLYGNVGLGKTHLMHAIAWNTKKNFKDKKVIYMSAETFMYKYILSLKERTLLSFKNHLRSVDILMIDDLQFISGKESTQEEFFHTFNALIDQKRQLVISADRSPNDLNGVEERIKSRLGWGLVADINPTTFELRMGILQSKLEQLEIKIPNKITEFIAKNITSSVRELEGALKKVVAHSSLTGQEISLDSTKEILNDLLRTADKTTTIDEIIIQTANHFNIKISEIKSIKRSQKFSVPRQIAMFLAKKMTKNSLPIIGKSFGRDHATVIHSIRKIDCSIKSDSQLNKSVLTIMEKLKNR
ncbi:chromosomal replication initiator protein DnaA [Anaplasmataceae bacterium AB001_6]|nr:chromosomal replication initiator protein DnaA [Anaplasmataceae bacterium AB001_6]